MAIWQTASHLCNAVSFEVNQVMPKNTFEYNHVVPCPGTRLLVRQNKWRLEVFSNASPCSWPTVSWNKHEGRNEPNDIIHEKTHQQGNTSSLNVHVSPLPLSLLPPLSVFEVRIQIHNAPNFTGQGLNYMGFWFCKPEFIAASLIPQAARTIWNTTMIKPQRFCSMCLRAVRGPPFISSVGSAQHCFRQGVETFQVGKAMSIVFSWCYVLKICNCVVALVAVLVVDLGMIWTWWQAQKRCCYQSMHQFKSILGLWPHRYLRSSIPVLSDRPKRYTSSLGFDSPLWTSHSSTDKPARSWINHGAPFFAWKFHRMHRGKLILAAIYLRISAASALKCSIWLRLCFCRQLDGWECGPIAWPQGPYHYSSWRFRPSWRVGSVEVARIFWLTYPFQVLNSIVVAIAVNVIHLPGCHTRWRPQKRVRSHTVHIGVMSQNLNLPVAWCCLPSRCDLTSCIPTPSKRADLPTPFLHWFVGHYLWHLQQYPWWCQQPAGK